MVYWNLDFFVDFWWIFYMCFMRRYWFILSSYLWVFLDLTQVFLEKKLFLKMWNIPFFGGCLYACETSMYLASFWRIPPIQKNTGGVWWSGHMRCKKKRKLSVVNLASRWLATCAWLVRPLILGHGDLCTTVILRMKNAVVVMSS